MTVTLTSMDYGALLPVGVIALTGLALLVADLLARTHLPRYPSIAIALTGAAVGAARLASQYGTHAHAFGGAFVVDDLSVLFQAIVVLGSVGSIALYGALGAERRVAPSLALLLWSACGAMLMAGAANLMTVFLGLELLSLALYTLCGMSDRRNGRESALKYLILSSIASGFLLYGIALLFGVTGSVALASLRAAALTSHPLAWIGIGLFFVGIAFKLSLVPFHTWAPDVYEGAPLPVTAFMSVVTKAGILAVLARVFLWSLAAPSAALLEPLWIAAGISMIAGNVGMLAQTDLKRMLAYSGIAQIGYVLAALAGGTAQGLDAAIYYFTAYSLMNIGAFAVAAMLSGENEEGSRLANYAGLAYRRPWPALAMTVFLLAMAGLPPTAGFLGKIFILRSTVASGYAWLGALLIAGTAVSLYAYGRIVRAMYDRAPHPLRDVKSFVPLAAICAAGCTLAVILLTFHPF